MLSDPSKPSHPLNPSQSLNPSQPTNRPQPPNPPPDQAAGTAARGAAADAVVQALAAAGGWIGFDQFMSVALYSLGVGYYTSGRPIFGAPDGAEGVGASAGDFTTAPELTPLFGATVARQLAAWLDQWPGKERPLIIEFGGGRGAMAASILPALAALGHGAVGYRIVELSAPLQQAQREAVAAAGVLDRVEWLQALPERIEGIVLANEVLDAMPVRVFECPVAGSVTAAFGSATAARSGATDAGANEATSNTATATAATAHAAVRELGVARAAPPDPSLVWQSVPADPTLAARVQALEREFGPWPRPYRSEIAEQAEAWVATVAERIKVGALLLIDYGFGDSEFYHPQRDQGTLMAHRQHRAHPDVLSDPGDQDISAHVPFSAIRRAAEGAGLETLGYCSQQRFLINAGLLELVTALPREPLVDWTRCAHAVQRLLSEAEMGELFKVVAFARGLPPEAPLPGFASGDRSGRL